MKLGETISVGAKEWDEKGANLRDVLAATRRALRSERSWTAAKEKKEKGGKMAIEQGCYGDSPLRDLVHRAPKQR